MCIVPTWRLHSQNSKISASVNLAKLLIAARIQYYPAFPYEPLTSKGHSLLLITYLAHFINLAAYQPNFPRQPQTLMYSATSFILANMDDTTDREREVANCLFQIDKLCDADLRAVLRHLATDDAVFSEAQCSHIANLVHGTLYQRPREAVNAKLNCASGFDAAVNWEKNFASYAYPGVSFAWTDLPGDVEVV